MSVYSVIPLARPRRAVHRLNHVVDTSANIGELIPTGRPIECVPGDTMDISQIITADLMPMIKPAKGNLWLESWAFFVTNDMLYRPIDSGKFTDILVSAQNPQEVLPLPSMVFGDTFSLVQVGKIGDYLGFPVGVGVDVSKIKITPYPVRGVYKIWDDYFRDENLQQESFSTNSNGFPLSGALPRVNYKKDRFTSAFQSEQKGSPITLGLGKSAPIRITLTGQGVTEESANLLSLTPNNSGGAVNSYSTAVGETLPYVTGATYKVDVDLSNATAVTINDLRLANKLQKWEERLQLAGSRPKEYLLANYGVCPNDETLQRPVLIGHIKTPVIVDSVIQNNPTSGSVSATKAGNGYTVSSTHFGKWTCKEFGWLFILSALRPDSNYTQGIHRSLIKQNVYDFFNPIFENLGQQEILNCELFAQNTSDDKNVWGYTDRYNEYRKIESMTTGAMRDITGQENLDPWVIKRKFATLPTLSSGFIEVNPSEYDYLFNFEHSATRPQAVIHAVNLIKAIRPISKYARPSL